MSTAPDGYVCKLTPESEKKAKDELNEDPKDRLNAVEALRTWIHQQPHLTFKTDTFVLLNFLRTAKFSQLSARERMENYARVVTESPVWFRNIDSHDPAVLEVMDSGYILPLPKKDKNGCVVLFYRSGARKKNGEMFAANDEMRAAMMITKYVASDENVQVNGFVIVCDLTGITMKHLTRWSMEDLKKWESSWEKSMPGRFKEFHYYNAGAIFEAMMTICRPFMSKKIQERLHVHETMESLYKRIPMELLPDEYLPDDYNGPSAGSSAQIIEKMKRDIMAPEFRQMMLDHSSERSYYLDESKRPTYKAVKESFRKLAVD